MGVGRKNEKNLAEDGFDPSTSGLWAQHAPTAPLCWLVHNCVVFFIYMSDAIHIAWHTKVM